MSSDSSSTSPLGAIRGVDRVVRGASRRSSPIEESGRPCRRTPPLSQAVATWGWDEGRRLPPRRSVFLTRSVLVSLALLLPRSARRRLILRRVRRRGQGRRPHRPAGCDGPACGSATRSPRPMRLAGHFIGCGYEGSAVAAALRSAEPRTPCFQIGDEPVALFGGRGPQTGGAAQTPRASTTRPCEDPRSEWEDPSAPRSVPSDGSLLASTSPDRERAAS